MGTAQIQHNMCLTCAVPGRRVQADSPAISPVQRTPGGGALGRVPGVTLPPGSLRAVYTALPVLFS